MASNARISKKRIYHFSKQLVRDGLVVLLHGSSRIVTYILARAAKKGVKIRAFITEANPHKHG